MLTLKDGLNSPYGDILRPQMSENHLTMVTDYEAMSARELELAAEETRLVQQYDQAMMQQYEITYEGEVWTEDKLEEAEFEDEETYMAINTAILKEKHAVAAPIFLDLVDIRTEIAAENGYSNYADYAYEDLYNRDFSAEEIRNLYPVVKKKLVPLFTQSMIQTLSLRDSEENETLYSMVPGEKILDTVEPYIEKVDPTLDEAFQYMRRNHLYDIEYSDAKTAMGFTAVLPSYGDAFIYDQPSGYYQDYWTVIHEFGHYNAAFHATERALFEQSTLDVAEIHSQGLEVLFFDYMDDMFGEDGEVLKASSTFNMLYAITEGFKYDEFQQTVYSQPDMTLEEISALAARLEEEYSGLPSFGEPDEESSANYNWVGIPHTFQSPFYYISYATSAMSALDIWGESIEDRESAVEKYMALTAMGFEVPYKQALEQSGLRNMLEEENINALSREIYTALSPSASKNTEKKEANTESSTPAVPDEPTAQTNESPSGAVYAGFAILFVGCVAVGFTVTRRIRRHKFVF